MPATDSLAPSPLKDMLMPSGMPDPTKGISDTEYRKQVGADISEAREARQEEAAEIPFCAATEAYFCADA